MTRATWVGSLRARLSGVKQKVINFAHEPTACAELSEVWASAPYSFSWAQQVLSIRCQGGRVLQLTY